MTLVLIHLFSTIVFFDIQLFFTDKVSTNGSEIKITQGNLLIYS